jgi:excisionase family DNA binding protein
MSWPQEDAMPVRSKLSATQADLVALDAARAEAASALQRSSQGRRVVTGDTLGAERSERALPRGDPHVVSVPEAARLLGISKDLAYDLARRGELPGAFQLGRRWRVSLIRLRAVVHGPEDGAAEDVR